MTLVDRLSARIRLAPSGCWEWTGWMQTNGYAKVGRHAYAHRVMYELVVGPIPDGYVIDHLCRVRHCVNPAHLEVVTQSENLRRAVGLGAYNARKTHCPAGHEYTAANTYRFGAGWRACRECRKAADRRYQERKAAAA